MNRIKAAKRKAPPSTLQRRVRARKDEPEDIPSDQFPEESNDEGEEDDDDEDEDESEDDDDEVCNIIMCTYIFTFSYTYTSHVKQNKY